VKTATMERTISLTSEEAQCLETALAWYMADLRGHRADYAALGYPTRAIDEHYVPVSRTYHKLFPPREGPQQLVLLVSGDEESNGTR
jgi:hypothetical protein